MFVCDKQVRYLKTYICLDRYVIYILIVMQLAVLQMVSQLFLAYICMTDICPALLSPHKLLNSYR